VTFADVKQWLPWTRDRQGDRRAYKWVVEPVGEGVAARAHEFWRYRRILWFLSVRGIKDSYEGYSLGIVWLFARPLLPIFISTYIFGRLLGVPSDRIPYFLFFLGGYSVWHTFERSLLMTTRSLNQHQGMLKKVYFPRLMSPISSVSVAVVWFGTFMGLLLMGAIYYYWKDGVWHLRLGPQLLVAPVCMMLSLVLAVAIGLWTSIWQLRFREIRFTLRYFTMFWSYLTPVIYPMSQVPAEHRWLIYANPMAPIVEAFKWALFGIGSFPGLPFVVAIGVIVLVLMSGLKYFTWAEASAIDRL
jgi:lipopolysaccharide transport system permease protein